MSVTFAWVLGSVDVPQARRLEDAFDAVRSSAPSRVEPATVAALAGWNRDPTSIRPSSRRADIETSEAFHRAFQLPLEPFVHDVVFFGAAAPWPSDEHDITMITADRIPPLSTLALALGPAWVARFPGNELQFFVRHDAIDRLRDTTRALQSIGARERDEMLDRAAVWIALHNFMSFPDATACEGREAAERLLDALPAAIDAAHARGACLFSACGMFP